VARVSILLTCYNHLRYLPEALASITSQTFTDYEIIAIDDGSTDGTRDWLSEQAVPMTRIFNEQNLGTYGSLNVALAAATGEFVAVLNDDDVWRPEKLARQIEVMDAHPHVGIVHTDGDFIDGDGNVIPGSPLGFAFPRFETGDILAGLLYENKIIASAALVRRQILVDLGGFNESYFGSGDWEMWLRVCEGWAAGFVAEPLTRYRVHGANASHKLERIWRDDQKLREWIVSREPVYRQRKELWQDAFRDVAVLDRGMAHNWAALGTVRTLNGDPKGGREAYAQSIRRLPFRAKSYLRWLATFLPKPWFRKLL
jgi:glycosyltransferase involved in cell wall biosynthesis